MEGEIEMTVEVINGHLCLSFFSIFHPTQGDVTSCLTSL